MFGQQDSYIENASTGQIIPMSRRNAMFVRQLKAQTSADSTKMMGFEESNTNSVFRRPFRERCKTIIETQARTEVLMARIEGGRQLCMGESERQEEHDECGNRKTMRMHDFRQPSEEGRIEHRMTHLPFQSWCRHCIHGRG